ncbi:hypothetical protein E2C01_095455 [Portunus trituberculatus]|uniref:Uncharacterized protein n=1 Tax=Portunus trituberculatus TaxID=210409 RepID=A0A5B7K494_PORTR|nr:hypothetical protein [Portunus trituberculatus]
MLPNQLSVPGANDPVIRQVSGATRAGVMGC